MQRCFTRIFFLVILFLTCGASIMANSDVTGTIAGIIIDQKLKDPLMGATIQIEGTSLGTVADLDGVFELPGLSPGKYKLVVKYISYKTVVLEEVTVEANKKTVVEIEMADESQALQGVVVMALMKQNTDVALLTTVKKSLLVQTGVSAQQITKNQDSDASGVIRRIPGISIIDNKFVMVRGLSQRYNNVWINNSGVPSSEADSRAFSFDIIPASQLDNMMVIKSPTPELPSDFSGGFIQIQTKDVPEKNSFSVSVGTTINDQTHFRDSYRNSGSATDLLGFDNGKRSKSINLVTSERLDNNDRNAVEQFTRNGFNNDWNIKKYTPVADLKLGMNVNRYFQFADQKTVALLAALNYANGSKTYTDMENSRYGIYNIQKDSPEYLYNYTDQRYDRTVRLGGMFNLTFIPRAGDKYEFKNIFNQLGADRYTTRDGYQNISAYYGQRKMEYLYTSRTTYSGQFTGTYNRSMRKIDWNAGYSFANKHQPDRRIIELQEEDGTSYPDHKGEYMIDQNEISRDFSRLNEHIFSGAFNYKQDFNIWNIKPALKTGIYSEYRTRDYNNRQFFYRWNEKNLPLGFGFQDVVSQILQPDNYSRDKLYIYEDTDNRNSYSGNNILGAAYLGLFVPIGKLELYGGGRFEYNRMELKSYTSIYGDRTKTKSYDDSHFFPSLNLAYRFNENHIARAAYGSSVNRPEFREVSNSVYYDFDLFSDVKGNPDLKTAYIRNFDLRYEYYPSAGELISVTLFYKNFRNPIEWTYLDAGGSYTYTFENAKEANNYGIELELRKNLEFIGLADFSVNLNAALIESNVKFDENSLEKDRPMQGQSPYLINAGLYYQNQRYGLNAAVLYNRIGKRIIGVGRVDTSNGGSINNDIPDSYEMPRNAIDVSFSKKFGIVELKLSANDLLAQRVQFKQFPKFEKDGHVYDRSQVTKSFNPGRSFNVSVSVNL
ncbi:MAG: TonB-dependent receptor [Bacteroidales bacterium]